MTGGSNENHGLRAHLELCAIFPNSDGSTGNNEPWTRYDQRAILGRCQHRRNASVASNRVTAIPSAIPSQPLHCPRALKLQSTFSDPDSKNGKFLQFCVREEAPILPANGVKHHPDKLEALCEKERRRYKRCLIAPLPARQKSTPVPSHPKHAKLK